MNEATTKKTHMHETLSQVSEIDWPTKKKIQTRKNIELSGESNIVQCSTKSGQRKKTNGRKWDCAVSRSESKNFVYKLVGIMSFHCVFSRWYFVCLLFNRFFFSSFSHDRNFILFFRCCHCCRCSCCRCCCWSKSAIAFILGFGGQYMN